MIGMRYTNMNSARGKVFYLSDYTHIRDLAKRYMEIANSPRQAELTALWRKHNSLQSTRPLYFIRKVPYNEFFDFSIIQNQEEPLRSIEIMLATSVLYRVKLQDDFVFKPWVTVNAAFSTPPKARWGVPCELGEKMMAGGAAAFEPQLFDKADLAKLKTFPYQIDEKETARRVDIVQDALGGLIGIYVNKRGLYSREWNMDISTDIAKLVGLENLMWDMYDHPDFLHELLGKMRDAVLNDLDAMEQAGTNCLADSINQSIPYANELPLPDWRVTGCATHDLWGFFAAQEYTAVSPKFFEEFLLQYQKPIMERFGLIAYGCCEDLTDKIPLLKKIKNLRRIAVTPFANVPRCAEQIGQDYVASWRPNPSSMIATGLDEAFVRRHLRENFAHFKQNRCLFDVTLKDVETIHHSPEDLIRWSQIVREEIERY